MKISYLCLALLLGCNTTKRIEKKLNKFNLVHPETVAKFTRDTYPCIVTSNDTINTIDTTYEFIKVDCPTLEVPRNEGEILLPSKPDGTIINKTRVIKVAIPQHTTTITKLIKDSAEVKVLAVENEKCKEENERKSKVIEGKSRWIIWLIIALASSTILNILLIKKK